MQADDVQSRQAGFVRYCLYNYAITQTKYTISKAFCQEYHCWIFVLKASIADFVLGKRKRDSIESLHICLTKLASSVQLLHQLRLLSCSSILVQQSLCASLVNTLDCNTDCSFLVSSIVCASSVSLLDEGLHVGLSCLVQGSLCLNNLNSLLCRFNVRHLWHLLILVMDGFPVDIRMALSYHRNGIDTVPFPARWNDHLLMPIGLNRIMTIDYYTTIRTRMQ